MSMKKGFPSKKEVGQRNSKEKNHKDLDNHSLTTEESQLLEKSFEAVKTLNKQVEHVEKSKKILEDKVQNLTKQIHQKENHSDKDKNDLLKHLKEEIMSEITPLFKKIDLKKNRDQILKDAESLIQDELDKLRAELSGSEKKLKRTFTQALSDLEVRLVEGFKEQAKLKQQISHIESIDNSQIDSKELEKKIENSISKVKSQLVEKQDKNLENVKKNIENNVEKSFKEFYEIKSEFKNSLEKTEKNLSSLQTKVSTLEKNLKSIKSEKPLELEKEVSSLKEKLNKLIEENKKNIELNIKEFGKRLEKIENEKSASRPFAQKGLSKEIKDTSKELNASLKQTKNDFSNEIKELSKHIRTIEKSFEKFTKDINQITNEINLKFERELESLRGKITKENNSLNKVDEQQGERITNIESTIKSFEKKIRTSTQEQIDKELRKSKEEISKQIISLKDFMNSTSQEIDSSVTDIKSDVENKISSIESSFKEEFHKQLAQFEEEFSEQQSNYVNKITSLDQEKDLVFSDIDKFRNKVEENIASMTKSVAEAEEDIKKKQINLENEKKSINEMLDLSVEEKEKELKKAQEKHKEELELLLHSYKDSLLSQEDAFRQVFTQKINSLWDHIDVKLDNIDKKFIQKNSSRLDSYFDKQKKELKEYEDSIVAKSKKIDRKLADAEKNELNFFEELHEEQSKLQKRVEGKLKEVEQQVNKKFLDEKSDMSEVKSVVLDEVEGMMKDIDKTFSEKISSLQFHESKLKEVISQAKKEFEYLSGMHDFVESEIRDMRDEVNDLKIKLNVGGSQTGSFGSVQGLVKTMTEYETHLKGLVKTLHSKGLSDDQILDLLEAKGHPKGYVSVLLHKNPV